jgi:hypothetical protein
MARIAGSHHVLCVKHLLSQLWDCQRPILLASTGCERGKARNEEVEAGERNHVDSQLPQISIELAREAKASGDSRHGERNQMVQVSIGGSGQLQGPEADVIESFIVDAESFIRVFNQLMNGECGIVGLNNRVGHFG